MQKPRMPAELVPATYPGPLQILFGVASAEDPICAIVRELIDEYRRSIAADNLRRKSRSQPKVVHLAATGAAHYHPLVMISDADVRHRQISLPTLSASGRFQHRLVNCF